jgi:hypothetical protein
MINYIKNAFTNLEPHFHCVLNNTSMPKHRYPCGVIHLTQKKTSLIYPTETASIYLTSLPHNLHHRLQNIYLMMMILLQTKVPSLHINFHFKCNVLYSHPSFSLHILAVYDHYQVLYILLKLLHCMSNLYIVGGSGNS